MARTRRTNLPAQFKALAQLPGQLRRTSRARRQAASISHLNRAVQMAQRNRVQKRRRK